MKNHQFNQAKYQKPLTFLFVVITSIISTAYSQITIPKPQSSQSTSVNPQVSVDVIGQYKEYIPSGRYVLAVVLDVPTGWHLYANPKKGEFGLDTEIIPTPVTGVTFSPVIYPPGEFHEDKSLNASNQIYAGRAVCYVPFELSADVAGPVTIHLDLKGQLCSDAGTCQLWKDQATLTIQPANKGQSLVPNQPELFADYHPQYPESAVESPPSQSGWRFLLLALAAGLTMNLMPCVLPIIPIIVLTLIRQCASDDRQPRRSQTLKVGLVFAAGIIVVFAGLAVVMSVFKLFWGQQFQSSAFRLILLLIVYVLSLSMFGLFEIVLPAGITNISVVRKGYLGTFAMGMLATVLATPCGAPLLTPVLTWSLVKPMPVIVAAFLIIGAGMAAPYVLLTAFPKLLNRIPKAGNWMLLLKHAIGFAMIAFTVYILLIFPPHWQGPLAYYCVIIGFCIWLAFRVVSPAAPAAKRRLIRLIALVLLAAASFGLQHVVHSTGDDSLMTTSGDWLEQLNAAKQNHQTVIVKFTAKWCKNCAALEKLIYKTDAFHEKLNAVSATLIIADGTNETPEFNQILRELGGQGQALPFAAVFPANDPDHPILLRDFYSLSDTLSALDEASKR